MMNYTFWSATILLILITDPIGNIPIFANATVFYLLDHLTSNIMLPLGGFALALFAGATTFALVQGVLWVRAKNAADDAWLMRERDDAL